MERSKKLIGVIIILVTFSKVLYSQNCLNYKELPHIFSLTEGYLIPYFKTSSDSCYDFNIIFVEDNHITRPLISSLKNSSIVKERKALLREFYLLEHDDLGLLESLFPFSWILAHFSPQLEDYNNDAILKYDLNPYHTKLINSESSQFSSSFSETKDSTFIYYKLIRIRGIFALEPLDEESLACHIKEYYKVTSYDEGEKSKYIYLDNNMKKCFLNYNCFSSIYANFLGGEYVLRWQRKKAKYHR